MKERNPGTSLRLCKIPISTPVKAAFSTTKLLSIADHVLNAIGIAIDISISKVIGLNIPLSKICFLIAPKCIDTFRDVQLSLLRLELNKDYED